MTAVLNLGCGTETRPDAHNVDIVPLDGVDEVVDLGSYPWPWPANSWAEIHAEHVFEHLACMAPTLRECARILQPGGQLSVTLPLGVNAYADPDHKHVWTWRTPEFYCGERHWDTDVGLTVVDRTVSLHTHLPGTAGTVYERVIRLARRRYGDGEWLFGLPATSGEFTVVFKHDGK